jgi:hypothetical protein
MPKRPFTALAHWLITDTPDQPTAAHRQIKAPSPSSDPQISDAPDVTSSRAAEKSLAPELKNGRTDTMPDIAEKNTTAPHTPMIPSRASRREWVNAAEKGIFEKELTHDAAVFLLCPKVNRCETAAIDVNCII